MRYLILTAILGVGYLSTTPWGGRMALEAVARENPPIPVARCPQAKAIVVLSGTGVFRTRIPEGETPNRIEMAYALYSAARAERIVLTSEHEGDSEGRENRALLMKLGVPGDHIVLVGPVTHTLDEAGSIAAALVERHYESVILVTSGYHMTRAKLLLQRAAVQRNLSLRIFPFPADPGVYERKEPGAEFRPAKVGWEHSSRALREVFGQVLLVIRHT